MNITYSVDLLTINSLSFMPIISSHAIKFVMSINSFSFSVRAKYALLTVADQSAVFVWWIFGKSYVFL